MHPPTTPYLTYLRACRSGLRVMIRLGSPDHEDCRYLGICEMVAEDRLTPGGCPSTCVPAYLRMDVPTGRLLLHVDDRAITPAIRKLHFPPPGFTVLRPYFLPTRIGDQLGLPEPDYRIATGTYPVLDDGTFTTLSLRLVSAGARTRSRLRTAA